jgi:hypothetical protein
MFGLCHLCLQREPLGQRDEQVGQERDLSALTDSKIQGKDEGLGQEAVGGNRGDRSLTLQGQQETREELRLPHRAQSTLTGLL